jgi:putative SOS response-associated peptidase YedK
MCGRYASTKDPAKLASLFEAVDGTDGQAPAADHNVAPTKPVLTVVQRHARNAEGEPDPATTERSIRVMRWGLVPSWAKSPSAGARMINARSETVASKPAFRTSLARRRCLLPADGWYEWRRDGGKKQPFYMTSLDGSSLAFAGIWSTWHDPQADEAGKPLVSCAVLTTDAVGPLAEVHERMPLLLSQPQWEKWLDPDATEVADLLAPPSDELIAGLELRPVSDAVNSVRNNGPRLLERVGTAAAPAQVNLDSSGTAGLFEVP